MNIAPIIVNNYLNTIRNHERLRKLQEEEKLREEKRKKRHRRNRIRR